MVPELQVLADRQTNRQCAMTIGSVDIITFQTQLQATLFNHITFNNNISIIIDNKFSLKKILFLFNFHHTLKKIIFYFQIGYINTLTDFKIAYIDAIHIY